MEEPHRYDLDYVEVFCNKFNDRTYFITDFQLDKVNRLGITREAKLFLYKITKDDLFPRVKDEELERILSIVNEKRKNRVEKEHRISQYIGR